MLALYMQREGNADKNFSRMERPRLPKSTRVGAGQIRMRGPKDGTSLVLKSLAGFSRP
jgi:hypothetical protein